MTQDILHDVIIDRLVAGGRGMAHLDGRPLFVPGVVPGDHVRVRILKAHSGYREGAVVALLASGAGRIEPRCPYFGACGGCQWQHMEYGMQVIWKQRLVMEQLERIGGLVDPQVLPTIAANSPWHYRSRIQLQRDDAGAVGFYRAGTHDVVEIETCAIAMEDINAALPAAREKLRRTGQGRHLRVDAAQGFAQINMAQNARLQSLVAQGVAARPRARLVELFCGSGNLTFPLASHVQGIVACDDHAESIRRANAEATTRKIRHVEFICTSAQRFVRRLVDDEIVCDGLLLDPPRCGAKELMRDVIALAPRWICYVSCDQATLARDLKLLCADGYVHECTQPLDMFPQTFHVETITWLQLS